MYKPLAIALVGLLAVSAVAETDYKALPIIRDIQNGRDNQNAITDLRVTDDAVIVDDASIGGDLTVTGAATLSGTASVGGTLTVPDIVVTNSAAVSGGWSTFDGTGVEVDSSAALLRIGYPTADGFEWATTGGGTVLLLNSTTNRDAGAVEVMRVSTTAARVPGQLWISTNGYIAVEKLFGSDTNALVYIASGVTNVIDADINQ